MPRNIEIKARIGSVAALVPAVVMLADAGPEIIQQDDTFFNCTNGRLKLRALSKEKGELIFYQRPDMPGPKESSYVISSTSEPDSLRAALTLAYGEAGRVRKLRTLFLIGRTRVHLDEVEQLGSFLELEVVLEDGESAAEGGVIARDLLHKLGIREDSLIEGAYIDLQR
jgi:adenylate cyclase